MSLGTSLTPVQKRGPTRSVGDIRARLLVAHEFRSRVLIVSEDSAHEIEIKPCWRVREVHHFGRVIADVQTGEVAV